MVTWCQFTSPVGPSIDSWPPPLPPVPEPKSEEPTPPPLGATEDIPPTRVPPGYFPPFPPDWPADPESGPPWWWPLELGWPPPITWLIVPWFRQLLWVLFGLATQAITNLSRPDGRTAKESAPESPPTTSPTRTGSTDLEVAEAEFQAARRKKEAASDKRWDLELQIKALQKLRMNFPPAGGTTEGWPPADVWVVTGNGPEQVRIPGWLWNRLRACYTAKDLDDLIKWLEYEKSRADEALEEANEALLEAARDRDRLKGK